MSGRTSPLAWLLVQPIRFYQRFITPYTPATCRYYPTCSSYAVRALRTHGAVKGVLLTAWRLLRCNPWSDGGIDHVPPRGRWRTDAARNGDEVAGGAELVETDPVPDGADTGVTGGDEVSGEAPAERSAAPDRFVTDPSVNAQPDSARAPIAGSAAA